MRAFIIGHTHSTREQYWHQLSPSLLSRNTIKYCNCHLGNGLWRISSFFRFFRRKKPFIFVHDALSFLIKWSSLFPLRHTFQLKNANAWAFLNQPTKRLIRSFIFGLDTVCVWLKIKSENSFDTRILEFIYWMREQGHKWASVCMQSTRIISVYLGISYLTITIYRFCSFFYLKCQANVSVLIYWNVLASFVWHIVLHIFAFKSRRDSFHVHLHRCAHNENQRNHLIGAVSLCRRSCTYPVTLESEPTMAVWLCVRWKFTFIPVVRGRHNDIKYFSNRS